METAVKTPVKPRAPKAKTSVTKVTTPMTLDVPKMDNSTQDMAIKVAVVAVVLAGAGFFGWKKFKKSNTKGA